jgi:hypothetical protein
MRYLGFTMQEEKELSINTQKKKTQSTQTLSLIVKGYTFILASR